MMDIQKESKNNKEFEFSLNGDNEKLKEEKLKAIKTLRNSQTKYLSPKSPGSGLNFTDYASYRWKDTFDISVTDKTIDLERYHNKTLNHITFEPSEITGRSTSCNPREIQRINAITTEQILATSFSEDVRNLRQSLCGRETESMPKTADLSKNSIRDSLISSSTEQTSSTGFKRTDESGFAGESFTPIENFLSKLSADEKEWEKEYADIPMDKEHKTQNTENANYPINSTDFSRFSALEPEMSMGSYFQKRTPDIQNIMSNIKSPKKHKPVALVNESDLDSERGVTSSSNRYIFENLSKFAPENEESRKSYLLSLSAIANALNEMDMNATGSSVVNRLLAIKSDLNQGSKYIRNDTYSIHSNDLPILKEKNDLPSKLMNNNEKENTDPKQKSQIDLSDTVSFTESLLDMSNMMNRNENLCHTTKDAEKHRNMTTLNKVEDVNQEEYQLNSNLNREKSRKRPHSVMQDIMKIQSKGSADDEQSIFSSKMGTVIAKKPLSATENKMYPTSSSSSSSTDYPTSSTDHVDSTNKCISSSASLENTVIGNQRFYSNTACSSPEYGKYSLPTYGLFSRMPSSSNLSSKSGSINSEYNYYDDKLPLKATCVDITWGSVKLRKCVQKSVQIKNTSHKRLVIRTEIIGPGFQIVNPEQGSLLTFHSQECRTITVSFCPTVIGVAVGEIKFFPSIESSSDKQMIGLYGYGGHASIIPQDILRGPVGSPFITMGELREINRPLTRNFTIYNKGSLTGFAVLTVDSVGLEIPNLCDSIEIHPRKTMIYPQSEVNISVTFRARRDDVKKILKKISSVITLANIRVISGDEPTRQRIRRLIRKMTESEKSKISVGALDQAWKKFPDETEYNLESLKEESEAVLELIETLRTHEIALTLNHMQSLDESVETTLVYPEGDETVMFRTIISNYSEKDNETLRSMKTSSQNDFLEVWSISPHVLEIDPVNKKKAVFTVSNKFCKVYDFQIDSNFRDLFEFHPREGKFYPNRNLDVTVIFLRPGYLPTQDILVNVYIENAKLSIPVKIKNNYPQW